MAEAHAPEGTRTRSRAALLWLGAALLATSAAAAPAAAFDGWQSCGRSGCHTDVTAQWEASAHR